MRYFSIAQIAAVIGLSHSQIRVHIQKGYLKAETMEGTRGWRVKETEADKWAASRFGTKISTKVA